MPARHCQSALWASAFGAASLIAMPAQATNQYCNLADARSCNQEVVRSGDTYFWAPAAKPNVVFPNQTTIVMGGQRFPAQTHITLRGPSSWAVNATGTPDAEVLIGSLGANSLRGLGGKDTYVVGNETNVISNLPTCTSDSGDTRDCVIRQSPSSSEGDRITLDTNDVEVIVINRCLQVKANGNPSLLRNPGLGGNEINSATAFSRNQTVTPPFPAYSGSDATFVSSCPEPVASLRPEGLWASAQRGREALLAPWERWWPASTNWNQAISWLQQTLTALLQGPRALAKASTPAHGHGAGAKVPDFPGVARLIEAGERNFVRNERGRGDIIVVDNSTATFNGRELRPRDGRVFSQQQNSDPIPLNKGYVFVYHQQMGILASYGTDRYPYGTRENPGTVISQLVLPDGRAQPVGSIDFVVTENLLTRSCDAAPARRPAEPVKLFRP
jgi:hypothetical protein